MHNPADANIGYHFMQKIIAVCIKDSENVRVYQNKMNFIVSENCLYNTLLHDCSRFNHPLKHICHDLGQFVLS